MMKFIVLPFDNFLAQVDNSKSNKADWEDCTIDGHGVLYSISNHQINTEIRKLQDIIEDQMKIHH